MEYEVRFYYPISEKDKLLEQIQKNKSLTIGKRKYEKTVQYDHPCEKMSFYKKEIDGRFRIRVTKDNNESKCRISWKRRLPSTIEENVNKEEEVEINIESSEYKNLMFIIDNVLKMKCVESYERYRTTIYNDEIEIALDEYPFGLALEIENKSKDKNPKKTVEKWTKELGLDINKAYRLSWDDKYTELCKEQCIKHYNHVTFDLPMPQVKE